MKQLLFTVKNVPLSALRLLADNVIKTIRVNIGALIILIGVIISG